MLRASVWPLTKPLKSINMQLSRLIRRLHLIETILTLSSIVGTESAAIAQGVTGSAVTGTVTDEGGGAVAGARVQLKNRSTGESFVAFTSVAGKYFIDNVPAGGPYTINVTASAYEMATRGDIRLTLGQRLTVGLVMHFEVGEYEVLGHLDELDDRSRTGPSTTMKDTMINELPLGGRNFTELIQTVPQVGPYITPGTAFTGSSIGGQNNRYNTIQIDGGANNDLFGIAATGTPGGQANAKPLSLEAIQEFVVQVAPFDVRQGSFTGGLINAITKSGTNEFQGTAFSYFQNKALAGNQDDPTFLNYTTWQFGGSLGGPIIKDKAHFFIATDLQVRQSAFGNQYQIGGVDSATDLMKAGFDAATAQRFANILSQKYGINAGSALATDLGNPDRNVFVKGTTSLIKNSHLEVSYNMVNANQDSLTRAPTTPTVPGRLRDGYELSNAGYGQANTTH